MTKYKLLLALCLTFSSIVACNNMNSSAGAGQSVTDCREPSVSGQFYPAGKEELHKTIMDLFGEAKDVKLPGDLIAVMAPHAGYVYSGRLAAQSFRLLRDTEFDTVILMSNAHRLGFVGAAVFTDPCFRTPLGDVSVAVDIATALTSKSKDVFSNKDAHSNDHTLEVQLPFLQATLKNFTIVPILFGIEAGEAPAVIIRELPGLLSDRKPLIVMSTDLTHYPSYEEARRIDEETLKAVISMDIGQLKTQIAKYAGAAVPGLSTVMCGDTAVMTGIQLARSLGADKGQLLASANSGDAGLGGRDRVVGYGSVAFYKSRPELAQDSSTINPADPEIPSGSQTEQQPDESELPARYRLSDEDKQFLLTTARTTLEQFVREGKVPEIASISEKLQERRGAFVTLKIHKDLRGCIGYIKPLKSLLETVIENTINAASKDFRFPPVRSDELDKIEIEISALTPLQKIGGLDEFVIGRDGIQINKGFHSAVFLPQVAPEQGWTKEETARQLCLKAGMAPDSWKSGAEFNVFQADVFSEPRD